MYLYGQVSFSSRHTAYTLSVFAQLQSVSALSCAVSWQRTGTRRLCNRNSSLVCSSVFIVRQEMANTPLRDDPDCFSPFRDITVLLVGQMKYLLFSGHMSLNIMRHSINQNLSYEMVTAFPSKLLLYSNGKFLQARMVDLGVFLR